MGFLILKRFSDNGGIKYLYIVHQQGSDVNIEVVPFHPHMSDVINILEIFKRNTIPFQSNLSMLNPHVSSIVFGCVWTKVQNCEIAHGLSSYIKKKEF
jgi:hypothetical protein